MFGFRPQYWSLIALLLALVHPSASHPIRTPKWIKKDQLPDAAARGIWKVFEKNEYSYEPALPQAKSMVSSLLFTFVYQQLTIRRHPITSKVTTAQLNEALPDASINEIHHMENQWYPSWSQLHQTHYHHRHRVNTTAMMQTADFKNHPSK
jgi:hypothetical protein